MFSFLFPQLALEGDVAVAVAVMAVVEMAVAMKTEVVIKAVVADSAAANHQSVGPGTGARQRQERQKAQPYPILRFIRHLRMYTDHSARKIIYTMDDIVDKCLRDLNGQTVTIAEYFLEEYNIELLQFPLVRNDKHHHQQPPVSRPATSGWSCANWNRTS